MNDYGKGVVKASGKSQGDERKRTAEDASKSSIDVVKTGEPSSSGTSPEDTCLLSGRQPVYRRHDPGSGSCTERGNLFSVAKGNPQAVATVRENTNVENRGGAARSSVETPVMGGGAKGPRHPAGIEGQPERREEPEKPAKPFEISKRSVWEAYKMVKANKGSAGVDAETIAEFEADLANNLYRIWNRMSSGTYFPPPVKQVEIPKKQGGVRVLGIPTVADRVAQTVVKLHVEPAMDAIFDEDSYGYRPGKSAKKAVAATRERCWQYDWVVEFDIKGAFDHIDHDLLMRAVRRHVNLKWAILYIERWLKAPSVTKDGKLECRELGTPQGGVISPLMMNLFMHYAFDTWMRRKHPKYPFARYADDAVVHCRNRGEACMLLSGIEERLRECRLKMHPDKSRIVYCKDSNRRGNPAGAATQFTFLGFTFRPRQALSWKGARFTSFLPAVSPEAAKKMRGVIKSWNLQRQTPGTIEELSKAYNPVLTGWWNYYGDFYQTEMRKVYGLVDLKLARWVRRKYKSLAGHKRRSVYWLGRVARRNPGLFIHWVKLSKPAVG